MSHNSSSNPLQAALGAISPTSYVNYLGLDQLNQGLKSLIAKPNIQAAPAAPTAADAVTPALTSELAQEKQMRSSWSILTGGQGVLDTPKTSSPTLLGS